MNAMEKLLSDRFLQTQAIGDKFSTLIARHIGYNDQILKEIIRLWSFLPPESREVIKERLSPQMWSRIGDLAEKGWIDNGPEFNALVEEGRRLIRKPYLIAKR